MSEDKLKSTSDYAENIVHTVREPLLVLDDKFRVISANRSFYSTFKVTPEMSENTLLFDLGNGQWEIPRLRELLEKVLPKSTTIEDFEVEHDFPDIGQKTMLINARRVQTETGATQMILLAIEDITERRSAEEELKRVNAELKLFLQREEVLARLDLLTGLANRRSFYETAKHELERAIRYKRDLTLAYIDLDNFKSINDSLGHEKGDELLASAAATIRSNLRAVDTVARIGGDEFAMLLPETDEQAAVSALQKLRETFDEEMKRRGWSVTMSIGAVTVSDGEEVCVEDLVLKADGLMYLVKDGGKDGLRHQSFSSTDSSGAPTT
ncbi:MAG: sensor domain-containing diguanylate cyclase [Actinobacteria bacterium]|nr:sensor domain-containing diguanylate cyclase [Actinomycetota bacterium]MBU1943292.1 sensor domain-containing diguanylate cyclase [Actinomycetota bacterium]MBU2686590.1 sensor domain-containing diguanylate cyclase [Actinomycetota bacterium]